MAPTQPFLVWRATLASAWKPPGLPGPVSGTTVFLSRVAVFWRRRGVSPVHRMAVSLLPRVRQGSEGVDVNRGQLVRRLLNRLAVVMGLDELAPVGRRAPSRRERWRRDEIGAPVEKLKRRQLDDAVGTR